MKAGSNNRKSRLTTEVILDFAQFLNSGKCKIMQLKLLAEAGDDVLQEILKEKT